jgi:cold shock CspA family protein
MSETYTGVLKFMHPTRGFGFLIRDGLPHDSPNDFVHVSAFQKATPPVHPADIRPGMRVAYQIESATRGRAQACNLRLIVEQPEPDGKELARVLPAR